jgi:hypothetical protein
MRVFFDHNVPAPLRHRPTGHDVMTAHECGWADLTNGELLKRVEDGGWDILVTTDQGIRYQQNLRGRRLALIVIDTNDWTRIRNHTSMIVDAISRVTPGDFRQVEIPE